MNDDEEETTDRYINLVLVTCNNTNYLRIFVDRTQTTIDIRTAQQQQQRFTPNENSPLIRLSNRRTRLYARTDWLV